MWRKISGWLESLFQQDFFFSSTFYALLIFFATILLGWGFRRFFSRFILNSTMIMKNDPTNYLFLKHAISGLIYVIGFSLAFYEIEYFRNISKSLLAGAGILAVAVGFASQHALSNVVSGIFLIIFKPYRINDRVVIRENLSGIVQDITLRHTVIKDFQNRRIVIPNSVISEEVVINSDLEDEKVCRFIELNIRYQDNLELAKSIMQKAAESHPLHLDNRSEEEIAEGRPMVLVRTIELNDIGVRLRAYVWAATQQDGFILQCDVLEVIKKEFDQHGIVIPTPYLLPKV